MARDRLAAMRVRSPFLSLTNDRFPADLAPQAQQQGGSAYTGKCVTMFHPTHLALVAHPLMQPFIPIIK